MKKNMYIHEQSRSSKQKNNKYVHGKQQQQKNRYKEKKGFEERFKSIELTRESKFILDYLEVPLYFGEKMVCYLVSRLPAFFSFLRNPFELSCLSREPTGLKTNSSGAQKIKSDFPFF